MSNKQANEVAIVERFLKTLHKEPLRIEPHDRPDVIVELRVGQETARRRVGIEVRRHFNDENTDGGSEGQHFSQFWADVRREIETLVSEADQLCVHTYVVLNKRAIAGGRLKPLQKDLARQIFEFVGEASQTAMSDTIIIPGWEEERFSRFQSFPLLQRYVSEIRIRQAPSTSWAANVNASYVGINLSQLAAVVSEKIAKAKAWDRESIDELWLLVAASHDNVFNAMHDFPDQVDFTSPELTAACENSPFDKIFFWSSAPHEWFRQIWPCLSIPVIRSDR